MKNHRKHILCMVLVCFIVCGGMLYDAAAAANRGYAAPANALPKDLKGVTVKDYFIPANVREVGSLQTVMAHVVVARGDLSQAYFAAGGDKLYEKDIIFTLKDSKCRIKLHNDDIITLGDNTRLAVKEATGSRDTPEKKSAMALARGKAMFYAIRLLKHKGLSMTVESPTATAGVRGTKFGMEVTVEEEKTVGALPLLLADSSENWGRHLILAQQMPPPSILGRVTTTVHGFDGTVAVTSAVTGGTTTVGAGQTLSSSGQGLGSLIPTPPQVSQRFQSQTNVPPPAGGSTGGGQTAGGGSGSGTGTGGGTGQGTSGTGSSQGLAGGTNTTQTTTIDLSSLTQTQLTQKVDEAKSSPVDSVTDPKTNASSGSNYNVGYFASMLTDVSGGRLGGVFVSQNRYNGDTNIWARSVTAPDTDFMRAQGNSGQQFSSTPYLKFVSTGGKGSGDLGTSNPISTGTIGRYYNLEWGYATVPKAIDVGGSNYTNDNRTYWIFGANTPTMSGFSGTAAYSGKAYGTYWTSGGGTNMTGTFSTNVDFTSRAISYFVIDVAGGNYSAKIDRASGTIAEDSSFSISGGTWTLNGATPTHQKAYGSFYSGNADSMGGVWGMYNSASNTGAVGIFQGDMSDTGSKLYKASKGFFTGMLENSGGSYVDTYTSSAPQDFDSAAAIAYSTSGSYSAKINGSGTTKNMTDLTAVMGSWNGTKPVTFTKIGSNAYMEWGKWTQPVDMNAAGYIYSFQKEGWYVWGDATTDAQMASLKQNSIVGNYTGPANGTILIGNAPINDLKGTFSAAVSFASSAIANFNVDVANGSNRVLISNAAGTFSGATSGFVISPSTGTWTINGNAATSTGKAAYGAVYGPYGQDIGGVWRVSDGANKSTGVFQGRR